MQQDVNTLREILNQPSVWERSLAELEQIDLAALTAGYSPLHVEWVFVGCGTSYYLAQAAAASFAVLLQQPTRALPASEILLQPHLSFPRGARRSFPVLISRSGHTSEVLKVAEYLKHEGVEFLAVTCDGRELADTTSRVLRLPVTESSTVMTSSFTSMLLGLQYLAAWFARDGAFLAALRELPEALERLLQRYATTVQAFAQRRFEDFVFLGQGPLFAIACETALKVMESSSSYAQYFHTLEFRHGPKSVAGPATLIGGLLSESGYATEEAVLLEMKKLGAAIYAVTNSASPQLRETADLLIELDVPVPELARTVLFVVWGQLLGSYHGLSKGLDPDNPTNLTRVVTL